MIMKKYYVPLSVNSMAIFYIKHHCTYSMKPQYVLYVADEHILIGAEEGLYTLNLNEIHEASLELVWYTFSPYLVVPEALLVFLK